MATTIITKYGSGAPAATDVVRGELAVDTENKRLYTEDSGGSVVELGTNPAANVTFGDNVKAVFGAGSDLEILSNGTDGLIRNGNATGEIRMESDDRIIFADRGFNEVFAVFNDDDDVKLYHDGNQKLATTSTGIDVTGTVTADDLDVNNLKIESDVTATPTNDGANYIFRASGSHADYAAGDLVIQARSSAARDIYFTTGTPTPVNRMVIDSSGNVGIGTASPNQIMTLDKASGDIFTRFDKSGAIKGLIGVADSAAAGSSASVQGDMIVRGQSRLLLDTVGTTALTIDSSQNVGIGLNNPSDYYAENLVVAAADEGGITIECGSTEKAYLMFADGTSGTAAYRGYLGYDHNIDSLNVVSSGYMNFFTADPQVEAMRIDSSGNLLVGTTNTAAIASQSPNVVTDLSFGINDTANKVAFGIDRINFDSSNYYVLNASSIGVKLVNGATSWTTQSDETLKENITALTDVLPKVQNLRCVSYNLKSQTENDVKLGFIAQDWQADFPQVVNADASDGKLGMNYTETIPVLLKAIQEQQDLIESLTARIAALEGAN